MLSGFIRKTPTADSTWRKSPAHSSAVSMREVRVDTGAELLILRFYTNDKAIHQRDEGVFLNKYRGGSGSTP